MTDSPPISLVCFDLTSIVIDGSIVERAFAEAIATQGLVAGTQDYARSMVRFDRSQGRAPAAVLRDLFDGDEPRAQAASLAFERSFRATAQRFGLDVPVDVADAMGKTAGSGAKICLLTMLSRRSCGELLGLLHAADLVLCGDDAPRGFPWPDPVLTAMLRLGAADVREVAVVSATPDGVLSGYRAGARILVGVGSGHRAAALFEAGATHVLDSITTLPDLVAEVSSAN
ncbi:MAG TPA: HAD family hydrolase [Trebonia sp.]|jgi:beta-phosphoglucomutase-like phosphatase (HAD superfamily)|nr:HAD family hydrolase [Trebonia sp.]